MLQMMDLLQHIHTAFLNFTSFIYFVVVCAQCSHVAVSQRHSCTVDTLELQNELFRVRLKLLCVGHLMGNEMETGYLPN